MCTSRVQKVHGIFCRDVPLDDDIGRRREREQTPFLTDPQVPQHINRRCCRYCCCCCAGFQDTFSPHPSIMMLRRVVRAAYAQRSAALLLRGSSSSRVSTVLLNQPLVYSNLSHVVTTPFAATGASATRCWMSTSVKVPLPPTSNHKYTPLPGAQGSIIYTETDEAPALATYSLYPVIAKVCVLFCLRCIGLAEMASHNAEEKKATDGYRKWRHCPWFAFGGNVASFSKIVFWEVLSI